MNWDYDQCLGYGRQRSIRDGYPKNQRRIILRINLVFKDSKELDITDIGGIKRIFNTKKFDYCINCAAYTNVDQAEKTPERAFEVNAEGVKDIVSGCMSRNIM